MSIGEQPENVMVYSASSVVHEPTRFVSERTESYTFGINALVPPVTDTETIMQRADEVNSIQRMLSNSQTSAVMLIGDPGVGKSILAALLFRRLQLAKQMGMAAPQYLIWLSLGSYTTLPDMIAAILSGVDMHDPGFFLLKPEQQISSLLRALRRPQTNALIVIDQFESLLHPETTQGAAGRGALSLFLDMLQTNLGSSRLILTSYHSPYDDNALTESRVRSYLITRITIPEGIALMQRRGVKGTPEELSLVWQRCAGHAMSLTLICALVDLSNLSLSYLLNLPNFQPLWTGDIMLHLVATIDFYFNATQFALMRILSLFSEPVTLEGIVIASCGHSDSEHYRRLYDAIEHELETLVRLSLVQVSVDNDAYFTIHLLLRQYIQEHFLEESDRHREELRALEITLLADIEGSSEEEQQQALSLGHMQIAAYYCYLANKNGQTKEQRHSLHDIKPLVSAVRHLCLGQRWQEACNLLFEENLHDSMVQWGAWNALIGLYTAMLPPFGSLTRKDEGLIYGYVGLLYGRLGEQQQSKGYFDQAIGIQRQLGDIHGEAISQLNMGELMRIRGAYDLAKQHFEQTIQLLQEQPDQRLQCIVLHNLGLLFHAEKDMRQAYICYQEALKLTQGQQKLYKGLILTNLGMLFYEQGMHREGMAILLAALKLRQNLQDPSAVMLELFLRALEQKMGSESYSQLYQAALEIQGQVFANFIPVEL